jgi:phospholipid/cholesterol/gamma-HCH transport system permease protein
VSTWQITPQRERLELAGTLRIADAAAIWRRLCALSRDARDRLDLDLHATELVDGAVMSLLVDLRSSLLARGVRCELVAVPAQVAPLVHLYHGDREPQLARATTRTPALVRFGAAIQRAARRGREFVGFTGDLALAFVSDVRRIHWRSVPALIERAGTDGIAIVAVLDFLVGFVSAYQSTRLLKTYGANIYVADIIGVSVTRELAPLMTAIIVAGRSGAAYAAELGTMRVSEEIDALRTMGFRPISHLVVPRILTLALIAPILTLVGDVAGVSGGLAVGVTSLGLTSHGYIAELRQVVVLSDVWTGLVKSVAFGAAIAFIGCRRGLATRGAASGVGRSATSTVVSCLFAIVAIDTLFTVVFREFGV